MPFSLDRLLKLIDPEPVLINQHACLRARHARSNCRACSDLCPAEAIGYADRKLTVDPAGCTRCGLCLGACPTAALQVRGIDETALAGATALRCAHAGGDGLTLPCLGALSVDHLVDLGSCHPGLPLHAGDCAACPLARGGEVAKANLAKATELLALLGVTEAPRWIAASDAPEPDARAISRRELLALWRGDAVQTGRSLLPEWDVNPIQLPARVPARRLRWLKRKAAAPQSDRLLSWPNRETTDMCNGCAICVSFCPTGALAGQDAGETWTLTYQPAACVDCGTCIDLCPRRAIGASGAPHATAVLSGERHSLHTVPASQRPQSGNWRPF